MIFWFFKLIMRLYANTGIIHYMFFTVIFNVSGYILVKYMFTKTAILLGAYYRLFWFIIYVLFLFLLFTSIRSTTPRMRLDKMLDFFWKYIICYLFIALILFILLSLL